MFCSNCGKQIADGSAFCSECGAKIEAPKPETKVIINNATPKQQKIEAVKQPKPPKVKAPKPPKQPKANKLPTWVIVAFAACGVFILIILIFLFFALARVGQLKRELNDAKNNNYSSSNSGGSGYTDYTDMSDMQYIDAGVTNDEAHKGYIKFLKSIASSDDELAWSNYYLYDMNKDGVDELIANVGSGQYDKMIYIATYCDGGLVYFDEIEGANAYPLGDKNGGLYIHYLNPIDEDTASESVVRYLITGDELYDEVVVEEHEGSLDDDFTQIDFDTIDLEAYDIGDFEPLE